MTDYIHNVNKDTVSWDDFILRIKSYFDSAIEHQSGGDRSWNWSKIKAIARVKFDLGYTFLRVDYSEDKDWFYAVYWGTPYADRPPPSPSKAVKDNSDLITF